MDTGRGYFEVFDGKDLSEVEKNLDELIEAHPNHGGVFSEGEVIELKGSRFRVSKIIRNGLKLALLPRK